MSDNKCEKCGKYSGGSTLCYNCQKEAVIKNQKPKPGKVKSHLIKSFALLGKAMSGMWVLLVLTTVSQAKDVKQPDRLTHLENGKTVLAYYLNEDCTLEITFNDFTGSMLETKYEGSDCNKARGAK